MLEVAHAAREQDDALDGHLGGGLSQGRYGDEEDDEDENLNLDGEDEDGGEEEKNRYLAKAPPATDIDGMPILPPVDLPPQKQLSGQEKRDEHKSKE